jgi:hypothetical protein
MPSPTSSLKDVLNDVALMSGVTYATMLPADKERWTSYANTAMDWIWRPPNRLFAWKWSVATKTITITDGKFALSEIDYSDWWNLWTEDPRPFLQSNSSWPSLNGYRVRAVDDGDGVWPQTDRATVFAFYRTARPRFISTVVTVATAYATGAIVYDDRTVANGGTGNCFKCVTGYTTPALDADLTTDLANTAKWTPQSIPEILSNPLTGWVDGIRRENLGQQERSGRVKADAEAWLDKEMAEQLPRDMNGPPWAYNAAGHHFDRFL